MSHLEPSPMDELEAKKWPWWWTPLAVIPFYVLFIAAFIVPKYAILLIILALLWAGTALAITHELGKDK